jgi:hypothetical protein
MWRMIDNLVLKRADRAHKAKASIPLTQRNAAPALDVIPGNEFERGRPSSYKQYLRSIGALRARSSSAPCREFVTKFDKGANQNK